MFKLVVLFLAAVAATVGVKSGEADWRDGRWSQSDVGPSLSSSLNVEKSRIVSCVSVHLGITQDGVSQGGIAFDSAACGVRTGWIGGFLTFNPARYGVIEHPRPAGALAFQVLDGALWNKSTAYLGYARHARSIVFHYSVGESLVSESTELLTVGKTQVFARRLAVSSHKEEWTLRLAGGDAKPSFAVAPTEAAKIVESNGVLQLSIPPNDAPQIITVLCAKDPIEADWIPSAVTRASDLKSIESLRTAGPRLFQDEVPVAGSLGANQGGFAFDDIPVPFKNASKALMFLTGVDFLPNGDLAVCSLHGDVWTVHGVDAGLKRVVWTRYATGLFQPLGLKVIDGAIYVLGRNQITRLEDVNNDGEADHYHAFFRNPSISGNGHDYTASLEGDSNGNLYYICPKGIHRVSKDGKQHEIIASGWRNPMGMCVGPNDVITASPQEGNWTPASQIAVVRPGGYYGFPGPKVTPSRPQGYDAPLCWLPRAFDNSTGGQTWLTGPQWGALQNRMVNLSYGRCAMQLICTDNAGNTSIVPVNYRFPAGICRGRVRPADGALYLVGTMGWQTNANVDGCLQRVRRTEKVLLYPTETKTFKDGIVLKFDVPLNRAEAEDPGSYFVEAWGYSYSKNYGSPEFTQAKPDTKGRDEWGVIKAQVSADGHSVFLALEPFAITQQLQIKYNIKSVAGDSLKGDIAFTIHAIPEQPYAKQ